MSRWRSGRWSAVAVAGTLSFVGFAPQCAAKMTPVWQESQSRRRGQRPPPVQITRGDVSPRSRCLARLVRFPISGSSDVFWALEISARLYSVRKFFDGKSRTATSRSERSGSLFNQCGDLRVRLSQRSAVVLQPRARDEARSSSRHQPRQAISRSSSDGEIASAVAG